MEVFNGSLADALRTSYAEVAKSFLVIAIMIWIVHRIFILTKRIVKGWDNDKTNKL